MAVIGITCSYSEEEWLYSVKSYYITSVLRAGGIPLVLPCVTQESIILRYLALCDGFILSGGGDADPYIWGEHPGKALGEISPVRDIFEYTLAKMVLESGKPLMGICRGCQMINIASQGSLIQDIEGEIQHSQNAPRKYPSHKVYIGKGSNLAQILNCETIMVNSFHHQAVKTVGRDLKVAACAPDGIIEAVEGTGNSYVLGIQWHPECMVDSYSDSLFQSLLNACTYNIIENDR